MDLLTDILHGAGLRRRLLDLRALKPGLRLRFPCERSIGLHTVTRGQVFLQAPGLDEPLALRAGDVALMARGCVHHLALAPDDLGPAISVTDGRFTEDTTEADGRDTASAQVVSGAYQLWNDPLHPFLREMPPWCVLHEASVSRVSPLALTLGLLDSEVRRGGLGSSTITHGLLDVVFSYALREIAERQGAAQRPSWGLAVQDTAIRRVLTLMHEDCAQAWTLEALAQQAGVSRTALAERFRDAMGDTPLNHLRTIRMQRAMGLLAETDHTLEQVARAVGYQDAFGFSKVFKRSTGLSPRTFRERDAQDRGLPWRIVAS